MDSWDEILDRPEEAGIVRASNNWLARLAAAAVSTTARGPYFHLAGITLLDLRPCQFLQSSSGTAKARATSGWNEEEVGRKKTSFLFLISAHLFHLFSPLLLDVRYIYFMLNIMLYLLQAHY